MNLIIISRCQSSELPPTLIFQSSFVRSSVLCCRATPSIPPSSSLSPPLTQPHVILGQPPVSHPKPVVVHSNDGKRWFPNRHLEKKLAPTESRALTTIHWYRSENLQNIPEEYYPRHCSSNLETTALSPAQYYCLWLPSPGWKKPWWIPLKIIPSWLHSGHTKEILIYQPASPPMVRVVT